MSRTLRAVALTALFAVIVGAGALAYLWRSGALGDDIQDPVVAGQLVLASKMLGLDGQPYPLEQWRGKVLVVNFWATWCTPCREEIPEFVRAQSQYGTHGAQFIGVAIDSRERVAPYAQEMGINYPLLVGGLEAMEFSRQVGNRQGVLPFTLVLDRSGKVAYSAVGILKPEKIESLFKTLL